MPKKSGRKNRRGDRGGPPGGGGNRDLENLPVDVDLGSVGNLAELAEPDQEVVKIVYVEPSLRRVEFVNPTDPITKAWLHQCINASHEAWSDHLPSEVQVADLTARPIPENATVFADVAIGRGVVVVELGEPHTNKGLAGKMSLAKANALTAEERFAGLEERLAKIEQDFLAQKEAHDAKVGALRQQLEAKFITLEAEVESLKGEGKALKAESETHKTEIGALRQFMKLNVALSNKVKKRVMLTIARTKVEERVGRRKGADETWSQFMGRLTIAEWQAIGVERKLVNDLLADGAHEFNDSIHNIQPEEVVGSIICMNPGSLRSAWEHIFFLVFQKSVTDQIFADEIQYTLMQQQLLGEHLIL